MGNQPDAVRDLVNTADIPYARRVFTQYAGFDPDVVWHTFLHTEAVFACALPNQKGRVFDAKQTEYKRTRLSDYRRCRRALHTPAKAKYEKTIQYVDIDLAGSRAGALRR